MANPLQSYYQGVDDREAATARQQDRQYQQSERQRLTSLRQMAGGALTGDKNALASLAQLDPSTYMQMQEYQGKQQAGRQKQAAQDALYGILYLESVPEQQRPQAYGQVSADLMKMYPELQIPQQYDPGYLQQQKMQLLQSVHPELAQKLLEKQMIPQDPKYQQVGDALLEVPTQAGGAPRVAYRAPRQAPMQGPTEKQRDFQFYGSLNPEQKAEYDRLYGKSAGLSVTMPDGTVVQQGGPAMKLTEQQSKDVGFYNRGADANARLSQQGNALAQFDQQAMSGIPGAGNYLVSPEFQQAQQSGRDFLAAILRKDTGAAITKSETDMYGQMYLPQPGDSPQTLMQKEQARATALDALRSGLGTAGGLAKTPKGATTSGKRKLSYNPATGEFE